MRIRDWSSDECSSDLKSYERRRQSRPRRRCAMLNRLVELSLRYKFLVLIIFAVVAFLGVNAVRNVPIDAFPDVTPVQVNVYTESPGLAAEDIELQIGRASCRERGCQYV